MGFVSAILAMKVMTAVELCPVLQLATTTVSASMESAAVIPATVEKTAATQNSVPRTVPGMVCAYPGDAFATLDTPVLCVPSRRTAQMIALASVSASLVLAFATRVIQARTVLVCWPVLATAKTLEALPAEFVSTAHVFVWMGMKAKTAVSISVCITRSLKSIHKRQSISLSYPPRTMRTVTTAVS